MRSRMKKLYAAANTAIGLRESFERRSASMMTACLQFWPKEGKSAMSPTTSYAIRPRPDPVPSASALEQLPHVIGRIGELWGQVEFEPYVNRLVMESRDGKRQGLPWDAARELFFLLELCIAKRALEAEAVTGVPFAEMFARLLASSVIAGQFGEGMVDLMTFSRPVRREATETATSCIMAPANHRKSDFVSSESALERLPHVTGRIRELWGRVGFEPYVNRLVMEFREGERQGLPWDMARELFFLLELCVAKRALKAEELTGLPFKEMFTEFLANSIFTGQFGLGVVDHWADPTTHRKERSLTL